MSDPNHPIDVQRAADELVRAGAPGAAARVDNESGIRQAASGLADLRTGRPMQPDLHFRVGSATKSCCVHESVLFSHLHQDHALGAAWSGNGRSLKRTRSRTRLSIAHAGGASDAYVALCVSSSCAVPRSSVRT
jgi:D-alanyl-D-alanine carboxypeptidase